MAVGLSIAGAGRDWDRSGRICLRADLACELKRPLVIVDGAAVIAKEFVDPAHP